MAWSEDVLARFDAYGWHTQRVEDGNDLEAIEAAIDGGAGGRAAQPHRGAHRTSATARPTRQDTQKAHGAPLGPDEVRLTKEAYGWDPGPDVPHPGRRARATSGEAVPTRASGWSPTGTARVEAYAAAHPDARPPSCARRIAGELPRRLGRRPAGRTRTAPRRWRPATPRRTRSRRSRCALPGALRRRRGPVGEQPHRPRGRGRPVARPIAGRNIRFGVREHAMGGIANGIAYHGGLLPYVATFLNFSDYMRGSVRLAALIGAPRRLRLDARLGRPRRGRTDPPAGRALRGAARHAQPDVRAARRPQRGDRARGRLAVEQRRRPVGARAHAPEAARPAGHRGAGAAEGCRAGRLRARGGARRGRRGRRSPTSSSSRPARSCTLAMAARDGLTARGHPDARRLDALLGALRGAAGGVPRRGAAARA